MGADAKLPSKIAIDVEFDGKMAYLDSSPHVMSNHNLKDKNAYTISVKKSKWMC